MPRDDLEEWADRYFQGTLGLAKRKTFGCPSYYKSKKMLAFLYEDGLCVKAGEEEAEARMAQDPETFQPFDPMGGKPMRGWVLIVRPEASDYEEDMPLIEASFAALP
jgi:hypothetical protein